MMLIKQSAGLRLPDFIKTGYTAILLLFGLACNSHPLYGMNFTEPETLTYYLNISDFAQSFIEIPTSNVSGDSSTIASSYLAGRASIYNANNIKVGICS